MPKANRANWDEKPIRVTGTHEGYLPQRHPGCGGEICYFERWDKEPGAYRCDYCGQRYRLVRPRGYQAPLGSFYD